MRGAGKSKSKPAKAEPASSRQPASGKHTSRATVRSIPGARKAGALAPFRVVATRPIVRAPAARAPAALHRVPAYEPPTQTASWLPPLDARAGVGQLALSALPWFAAGMAGSGFAEHALAPLLAVPGAGPSPWPAALIVLGLAAFGAGQAAGGAWRDHNPARRAQVATAGALFGVLALALLTVAQGLAGLLFAFLMLQAAAGIALGGSAPLLAEVVSPSRRGAGAGLRGGLEVLGVAAAAMLGAAAGAGDRLAVVGPVALALLAAGAGARAALSRGQDAAALHGPVARGKGLQSSDVMARGMLTFGAAAIPVGIVALLGGAVPDLGATESVLLGILALVLLAASLAGGLVADRAGRRPVLLAGAVAAAMGAAGLLVAGRPAEVLMLGVAATAGAGAALAACHALLADRASVARGGTELGRAGLAGALGAAAALAAGALGVAPAILLPAAGVALAGGAWGLRAPAEKPGAATPSPRSAIAGVVPQSP